MRKSKAFIKCDKGHRAQKVPGEKDTYFCSECELKITSDSKPHYPSQYEDKKKNPRPKKPKYIAPKDMGLNLTLFAAYSCKTCFHTNVCALILKNSDVDKKTVLCREHSSLKKDTK